MKRDHLNSFEGLVTREISLTDFSRRFGVPGPDRHPGAQRQEPGGDLGHVTESMEVPLVVATVQNRILWRGKVMCHPAMTYTAWAYTLISESSVALSYLLLEYHRIQTVYTCLHVFTRV